MAKGRPKLSKSDRMSAKLVFNVNADTYKRTRAAAEVLSMQLSDYLRHAVEITNKAVLGNDVKDVVDPYDRMMDMMKELVTKVEQ